MDDAEQRWRDAHDVLNGRAGPAVRERWEQTRRTVFRRGILYTAGGGLAGFVTGELGVWDPAPSHRAPSGAQTLTGLGILLTGIAMAVVSYRQLMRAGVSPRQAGQSPEGMLTASQRKQLLLQIRGAVPVDPDQLPLTRDAAERFLASAPILLTLWGVTVAVGGGVLMRPTLWSAGCGVLALGAAVFGSVKHVRVAARARQFLADHPAGSPG